MNSLYRQVDMAPLAIFRIGLGALLAVEGFGAILTGWVRNNYVDVPFTFNFIGFEFLQLLVGPQAYVAYLLLGIFGVMIAIGWNYRIGAIGYAVVWSAVYLGQKTSYNNHYYLMMILAIIICFIPLHHYLSMDERQGRVTRQVTTYQWHVLLFKWLLLVVYVYAAVAKIYPDWLSGDAIRTLLASKRDYWLIGSLFDDQWFLLFLAYGGILFDLLIIPAFWWAKSRPYAFFVALFFHIFNSLVFQIGIFPYMMLMCAVLFFDEKSVRKVFIKSDPILSIDQSNGKQHKLPNKLVPIVLGSFFVVMILLPIRHWFYEGNVNWTEEGHRLSWRMMLRAKSGVSLFRVVSADMEKIIIPEDYMPYNMARNMAYHPDMVWQFAQRVKQQHQELGYSDIKVYADVWVSLNGRPKQQLIDPGVNLANEPWHHFKHHNWILPEERE